MAAVAAANSNAADLVLAAAERFTTLACMMRPGGAEDGALKGGGRGNRESDATISYGLPYLSAGIRLQLRNQPIS